jgi:hypothetical protein
VETSAELEIKKFGAGYWVHAEAQEEFIQLVLGFYLR